MHAGYTREMSGFQVIDPLAVAAESLELRGAVARFLCEQESPTAIWMLVEHAPGSVIPRHMHSQASEWSFVLSGSLLDAEGGTIAQGHGFTVQPGVLHGPFRTPNGCRLLVTYVGVLDFMEL